MQKMAQPGRKDKFEAKIFDKNTKYFKKIYLYTQNAHHLIRDRGRLREQTYLRVYLIS